MIKFAVSDAVTGKEVKTIRRKLELTQAEFAGLANVSLKTVERWETGEKEITGPIVTLMKILNEYPQIGERLVIPEQSYPLRLWYMSGDKVCTIIDVDERGRRIKIYNYTNDYICRAFGRIEQPTFEEYEAFLESRCFPRSRDKMKLVLEELGLPFYDPFLIVEKTEGRMAEDDFWIRIERRQND
ncbi:MAG: type II toxin-antitoxin system MqsA family antitoxin [Eubacterium sp.]|nr:type II toxin-antitoxin system MqsA family antitoxin [Eubacterium sp.]